MTENGLSANFPVPGSGSTSEPGKPPQRDTGPQSGVVAAKPRTRQRAKPAPTLDQLQTRFRKRAEACRASGESPYAVLEAAIADTWAAAIDRGQMDALMAVQKDPRIAGILLAPLTDEQLGIVKPAEPKPSSRYSIQMTTVKEGKGVLPALVAVIAVVMALSWLVVYL